MNNFFTHPMRPFFVGAAILAIVGALSFFISPDDLILHRKIFLEFMLPAAYGGFLTASMLEWTNYKDNLKPIATILAVLLLAGLVLLPFSPQTASFLVAAYWLALLLFCAWLFWLDRNTDNFTLLMLLVAFMVCQTAYAMTDSLKLLRAQVHLNMAAVMFVSIRVSILLGAEALKESTLKDPVFIPNVVYKNIAITFLLLHTAAELWLPAETSAFTAFAVGFILLAKLRELHHHELLRKHYVRTYYFLQLFAAIGYLWIGINKLIDEPTADPLHMVTLGGILGSMMMIWLTAGLWHSGFTKLDYPKLCRLAVLCLFTAALSRACLMYVDELFFITIPAILIAIVFVLYLATFVPIFRNNAFTDDPE